MFRLEWCSGIVFGIGVMRRVLVDGLSKLSGLLPRMKKEWNVLVFVCSTCSGRCMHGKPDSLDPGTPKDPTRHVPSVQVHTEHSSNGTLRQGERFQVFVVSPCQLAAHILCWLYVRGFCAPPRGVSEKSRFDRRRQRKSLHPHISV